MRSSRVGGYNVVPDARSAVVGSSSPRRRLRRGGRQGGHAAGEKKGGAGAPAVREFARPFRATGDLACPDPAPALLLPRPRHDLRDGRPGRSRGVRPRGSGPRETVPSRIPPTGRALPTGVGRVLPSATDFAVLCLTGQMWDLVLEGERGAIRTAVLYSDLRSTGDADQVRAALTAGGADWRASTRNLQDARSFVAISAGPSCPSTGMTRPCAVTRSPEGRYWASITAGSRSPSMAGRSRNQPRRPPRCLPRCARGIAGSTTQLTSWPPDREPLAAQRAIRHLRHAAPAFDPHEYSH